MFGNPRAGRGEAAHSGATGRRGAGQDGTSTDRFAQVPTVCCALLGIVDTCLERPLGSTNTGNPM